MQQINISKLGASFGVCFLVAAMGSLVTMPAVTSWFPTLQKPFFSPPNWLFGPVWTVLYLMMAVAFYLVWSRNQKNKQQRINQKKGILVFGLQLFLNFLWSLTFFGWHSPLLALLVIIGLWLTIAYTLFLFYQVSKPAGYLLVPYLLWVSFATILNYYIVMLN